MGKRLLNWGTVLIAIIWALPIVWMFSTSFKYEADILRLPPLWIPPRFTMEHYASVLRRSQIIQWFVNSALIGIGTTFIVLAVDSLAAYAFARLRFFGRDILFAVVVASMMVPQQVTMVPLFTFVSALGFVNRLEAVVLPAAAGAFGVFLLRQFFLGVPMELEEAALIDGSSRLGILWRVILPLSKPALSALGIFTFLGSWNNFLWPLIVLQHSQKFTLPVGLANMQGTYTTSSYGILMAAAVISSFPILILFLFLKDQVISGITMTSGIK